MSKPSGLSGGTPFTATPEGVRVRVRLNPRAARERIGGLVEDESGLAVLKVTVTAAPVDGEANTALIRLLARTWGLPKGALAVTAGRTNRTKTITISGASDILMPRLAAWWSAHAGKVEA